jgi:hypothetical protein
MITIGESELAQIRRLSLNTFQKNSNFPKESKDLQLFLLLSGLEEFLTSKGIEPNFEVCYTKEGSEYQSPVEE